MIRLGDPKPAAAPQPAPSKPEAPENAPVSDGGEEDVTPGEDLYTVLMAAFQAAPAATQLKIATTFQRQLDWAAVEDEVRDVFEDAGEAFFSEE